MGGTGTRVNRIRNKNCACYICPFSVPCKEVTIRLNVQDIKKLNPISVTCKEADKKSVFATDRAVCLEACAWPCANARSLTCMSASVWRHVAACFGRLFLTLVSLFILPHQTKLQFQILIRREFSHFCSPVGFHRDKAWRA